MGNQKNIIYDTRLIKEVLMSSSWV